MRTILSAGAKLNRLCLFQARSPLRMAARKPPTMKMAPPQGQRGQRRREKPSARLAADNLSGRLVRGRQRAAAALPRHGMEPSIGIEAHLWKDPNIRGFTRLEISFFLL